jgi:hypothetical protein
VIYPRIHAPLIYSPEKKELFIEHGTINCKTWDRDRSLREIRKLQPVSSSAGSLETHSSLANTAIMSDRTKDIRRDAVLGLGGASSIGKSGSDLVYSLSASKEDKSVELKAVLESTPGVDVNLPNSDPRDGSKWRPLHAAILQGHVETARLLIKAKADLEARDGTGETALVSGVGSSSKGNPACIQLLLESKANVHTVTSNGNTAAHIAAETGRADMMPLLIGAKADISATSKDGLACIPAVYSCMEGRLACLQVLMDAKADISMKNKMGWGPFFATVISKHDVNDVPSGVREPGMPFITLSCNADSTNIPTKANWMKFTRLQSGVAHALRGFQAEANTRIAEYKQIQSFIDEYHTITKHALYEDAVVDKRVGRRGNGMYDEPLEQVLLYLGLSMKKNQTVNKSIDGKTGKRALIPGHPVNANLWFELYNSTHCSGCSSRRVKLKECPCFFTSYCNTDCQRKHWPTHKPRHKWVLRIKKSIQQKNNASFLEVLASDEAHQRRVDALRANMKE